MDWTVSGLFRVVTQSFLTDSCLRNNKNRREREGQIYRWKDKRGVTCIHRLALFKWSTQNPVTILSSTSSFSEPSLSPAAYWTLNSLLLSSRIFYRISYLWGTKSCDSFPNQCYCTKAVVIVFSPVKKLKCKQTSWILCLILLIK